ncbi:hypothetical protein [Bacillus mycoides]|uniref:Uncharacterized protein n=1 Tax=Bacillus mycoides TaxID=1405 RepID=A0A1G4EUM8_BACMY|nr:hypothetical protein [Bacillus mycoides]SCB69729.1 Uncharacterized protein BWGO95_03894 [Bacillus mycoides]
MRWWINVLITGGLLVFGGYIGSLFNDGKIISPPNLCWSAIVVFFAILTQFYINKTDKLEDEVKTYRDEMSAMMLTKRADGSKSFDITFDPQNFTGAFLKDSNYVCHIIINSPIKLDIAPDLVISTLTPWTIILGGNTISPVEHAGEYKYFIKNNYIKNITQKKYYVYEVNCLFTSSGEHKFTIAAETSEWNSKIQNSLEVH